MYAIIRAGGKQARVRSGDVIDVERVRDAGDSVRFTPLLIVDDDGRAYTGSDALADASVTAKVMGEVRGDKIDIFKYKNKTGYRRRMGHRQTFTRIEITDISMEGSAPAKSTKSSKKSKKTATKTPASSESPPAAPEESSEPQQETASDVEASEPAVEAGSEEE